MSTITEWLASLGMSEHAQRFADNRIDDVGILRDLTDQDLKDIGVPLGHRRKMLRAIADVGASATPIQSPAAPEPMPRDDAERRQLTVMFADLVGSTALSTKLDPEDLRSVIGAYHRCCTELVERNGGFVAKYMGDGVLAYFGYPQAHEHDAERAVRAGLNLVESVPKLATHAGSPLQVRIGIATGLVVVGDLIGAGAAQEQAVVGETPNLAARLQTLGEPGAVVISASTRKLIGGLFEYRDLGVVSLKGFAENVPAWQVLGAGAAESRFEALRATTTPLIGRDEEIDLLMRRWGGVKRGEGCVVLISGEPGIGKSRIAQTVAERISAEPHTRLRYFCSPHHQDTALYPSIAQLERAAGFRREDTADQRLAKLEAVLAQGANDLSEVVPLLAELLSIPTGGHYQTLNLSPQKRKEMTLYAQLAQVEGLAARQPVLMVFEDVQWSDPTTRESLELLIDRIPSLRVLLIITYRPEFASPWIGRPQVTLLSLSRLASRHRAEMIAHVAGGKALPKEVTDQIIDRTDGVPLFVEELTKSVVESGILTENGDRYAVTGPVASLVIPTTLHASLLARLDRLASVREIAQIAAALGRQFSHELISAVAQIPQRQVDDALAQLVTAELIFQRGLPPNAEYTFKHALVQDAAYGTLLRSRRQQLHGRIAAALEGQFPDIVETQPELLARHCAEAGMVVKALDYWLKAGQLAIMRGAMTEAVAQLQKGLDLLSVVPDRAARRGQELDLQIALGRALIATKGYSAPEPGEAYSRARQLCEQMNRPEQLVPVLYGQWVFRLVRGELDQAERHANEIRHLGEARNDVMWTCLGTRLNGTVCFYLGRFGDARTYLENALSLWDPAFRGLGITTEDTYVAAMSHLSGTLLYLGHVDQARSRSDEALAEARRLSPYHWAFALAAGWHRDWAIERLKSAGDALRSADEVLAISNAHGFPLFVGFGNFLRGWCLGAAGQTAEGIELIHQGIAVWRATGSNIQIPFWLTALAELYRMAADPEEGLDRLAEAAKLVETTQERWVEAEIHRVWGTLLLSTNERAAAENSFQQALTIARHQSAKLWELRAATSLARLWGDQGRRNEARDLLAPIYGWFTEGFDTPVLQDAKALLDQLA